MSLKRPAEDSKEDAAVQPKVSKKVGNFARRFAREIADVFERTIGEEFSDDEVSDVQCQAASEKIEALVMPFLLIFCQKGFDKMEQNEQKAGSISTELTATKKQKKQSQ